MWAERWLLTANQYMLCNSKGTGFNKFAKLGDVIAISFLCETFVVNCCSKQLVSEFDLRDFYSSFSFLTVKKQACKARRCDSDLQPETFKEIFDWKLPSKDQEPEYHGLSEPEGLLQLQWQNGGSWVCVCVARCVCACVLHTVSVSYTHLTLPTKA